MLLHPQIIHSHLQIPLKDLEEEEKQREKVEEIKIEKLQIMQINPK